jgi:hypothetical protein
VDGHNLSHSDSDLLLPEALWPELHLRSPISRELVRHNSGQRHRSVSFTSKTDLPWFVFVTDLKIVWLKLLQQKLWLVYHVLRGLSSRQKQQQFLRDFRYQPQGRL